MVATLKQYESYLKRKRKPNGDDLLPSTIERYTDWIEKHINSLNSFKDHEKLIQYMNAEIKKSNSNVLTAAFVNFLQMQNIPEARINEIKHCKSGATALSSHRFLQSKVLSRGELKRIMNELDDVFKKAIISCLYDTACRRAELLSIKFGDINFKNPELKTHKKDIEAGIYAEVQILGKGSKARTVYLGKTSVMHIIALHNKFGYTKTDKIFVLKQDDGTPYKLQENQLYKEITDIGDSVLGRHIHPHCFRHTKATHMADAGADMLDIAAYLGHSNPSTSSIYIEISAWRGHQAFSKYSKDILGES